MTIPDHITAIRKHQRHLRKRGEVMAYKPIEWEFIADGVRFAICCWGFHSARVSCCGTAVVWILRGTEKRWRLQRRDSSAEAKAIRDYLNYNGVPWEAKPAEK